MYIVGEYNGNDRMASLICDHYIILPIMSRFGISLGFADRSIATVCKENGVNDATFLAVVNHTLRYADSSYKPSLDGIDIKDVVDYLRRSHDYYLNNRLPKIRKKLLLTLNGDKISKLIVQSFDDYINEIKEHIRYEEEEVFPYIEHLTKGEPTNGYSIGHFTDHHDKIDVPLSEFKDMIIKYYDGASSDEMAEIIHDLLSCANDLARHNALEDRLLVPLIRKEEEL